MGNINVVVAGSNGYANSIGKRGTVTDITFFELKRGIDSVTLIEPTKYPEKLSSLFYATSMAKYAILVIEKIDSMLGEIIVMIDSSEIGEGCIILKNYIQPEQIKPLLAGTLLEKYEFLDDDPIKIREMLLGIAHSVKEVIGDETCGSCSVDSHFNVKGVGTVILGPVVDGYFKIHDKMQVYPIKKKVILKSIQKHDVDADSCVIGDHVGLALRGIESDELDRGYVITTDQSIKMTKRVRAEATLVKFWPSKIKDGMVMHVGHWMQMVSCHVISSIDNGDFRFPVLDVEFGGEIIHKPNDKAIMMYLEGGKLRIVGTMTLR
ncbi:MAG: translation elongation factor 1 alpha-related protein [archaeon]|nr:translation elongation factor 1 alpha-related protein [archaeon]